jgi:uncharacterized membrane protein
MRFEYALSGHSGLFIDKLRHPMPERFYSVRVGIGDVIFEIANDSYGNKDIGPTVAVRLFMNIAPGTTFFSNFVGLL